MIDSPPQGSIPAAVAVPIGHVPDVTDGNEPTLQLTGPSHLLNFGEHGCELPAGNLSPLVAPPWLEAACATDSPTAGQLVEKYILYKWPPRLGGWAVGKITNVQTDSDITVKSKKCNFTVFYDIDQESADHVLSLSSYARSAKSPSDSWVLLG